MSNLANVVTMLRVLVTPFFVVFMVLSNAHPGYRWVALVLFLFGAFTDFADGQIARRTGTVSRLGVTLDPLADRVFIGATLITLYALGIVPLLFLAVVLGRDVLMAAGYPFIGKIDPSRVAVHWSGKVATAVLFVSLALLVMSTPLMFGPNSYGFAGSRLGFSGYPFAHPSTIQFWGLWLFAVGMFWSVYSGVLYVRRALEAVKEEAAESVDGSAA